MEGQYYSASSILFADFTGFTNVVENCEPGELPDTLNTFSVVLTVLSRDTMYEKSKRLVTAICL